MDSPQPSHSTLHDIDPATDNSLSEVDADNLSDSDWLDISSREDTESIGLPESDRDEGFRRSLSRRSLSSRSSSREHEVEAWEGMVESTDDDGFPSDIPELSEDVVEEGRLYIRSLHIERSTEQQRVADALDQSMVSTLSASRASSLSASGSVHAAGGRPRDLRLSFPDPLTSSRDELRASYDVCNLSQEHVELAQVELVVDHPAVLPPEDWCRASSVEPAALRSIVADASFQVVLYGSAPANQWHIVGRLLDKLGLAMGLTLSDRHAQSDRASTYRLNAKGGSRRLAPRHVVSVVDNTEAYQQSQLELADKPSLAIIFLPSLQRSLPQHTRFLPVLLSPSLEEHSNEGFSDEIFRRGVEEQWALLNIPTSKRLLLNVDTPTTILTEDDIQVLDPSDVALGFQPLLPPPPPVFKALKGQIAATPAMTILAILSIVIGYIVSRSFPFVPGVTPTEKQTATAVLRLLTNASNDSLSSVSSTISTALSLSSANEVTVAVFTVPPSSLSTLETKPQRSPGRTPVEKPTATSVQSPTEEACVSANSRSLIIPRHFPSSLSLPAPLRSKALSIFRHSSADKTAAVATVPLPAASESLYSLSTRLASSLSDMFNAKALARVLNADMRELIEALDELVRVLGLQVANALDLSKAATHNLREQLWRRNRQAQERARTIRARGEKALITFSEQAMVRVDQARSRARAVRDAVSARVGKEVETVHRIREDWEQGLGKQVRARPSAQARKLARELQKARGRMGF